MVMVNYCKHMTKLMEKLNNFLFFTVIIVVVLWQMLLPGFVLTLDMVFAPEFKILFSEEKFLNALPLLYILKFLNLFLTGWLLQKVLLVALFFLLAYLPYKFLEVPEKYYARYWASIFYVINPFVYERFLAGQIAHLFAYAFLPPIIFYAQKIFRAFNKKDFLFLVLWLLLINIFSVHFFVISILLIVSLFVFETATSLSQRDLVGVRKKSLSFAGLAGLLLLVCSYWLIPYFISGVNSALSEIGPDHWRVYSAAVDARVGTILNIVGLYGYWGERELWAQTFLWAKDNLFFWLITLSILLFMVVLGFLRALRSDRRSLWLAISAFFALVFATGAASTIFQSVNIWLYEHIGFWVGFRDSAKFVAVIALAYAYFGGWGIYAMGERLKLSKRRRKYLLVIFFALPLFYAYPMLGGFARQLKTIQYPVSWVEVDRILQNDKEDFKVLFLPWHGYMSFPFSNNLVIANPAKFFFTREVIQADSSDLEGISETLSGAEKEVDQIIRAKSTKEKILKVFNDSNIKYVVVSNNLDGIDGLDYSFLSLLNTEKVYVAEDLTIFKVLLR